MASGKLPWALSPDWRQKRFSLCYKYRYLELSAELYAKTDANPDVGMAWFEASHQVCVAVHVLSPANTRCNLPCGEGEPQSVISLSISAAIIILVAPLLRVAHRIPHCLMPARSLLSGGLHQPWPVMLCRIPRGRHLLGRCSLHLCVDFSYVRSSGVLKRTPAYEYSTSACKENKH